MSNSISFPLEFRDKSGPQDLGKKIIVAKLQTEATYIASSTGSRPCHCTKASITTFWRDI